MKMDSNISGAEWEVMKIIWKKSPVSAHDVVKGLESEHRWSVSTIKTLLNRLLKKEVLSYQKIGRQFFYEPRISGEKCRQLESESFLERVFDGALPPMVAHFVEHQKLSENELAELERIIKQKMT